ncbi:hypothetical protein PR202_ga14668 [Eleusine coracana subsp. coracana]|uniref:Uncharacterized protein n=1 Tax=Eleusine coracana subsp. coracana TaxID=191504 RepID=A0AAV5CI42_ELECO|nr:hypothetical protein PR202_ga14668 [Eleusine coracana subsp. coracana]
MYCPSSVSYIKPGLTTLEGLTCPAPILKCPAGLSFSSRIGLFLSYATYAVVMIADLMAAGDQSGCTLLIIAAMPLRCGAAIDVPDMELNMPCSSTFVGPTLNGQAAMMFTPGPMISGLRIPGLAVLGPRDEK